MIRREPRSVRTLILWLYWAPPFISMAVVGVLLNLGQDDWLVFGAFVLINLMAAVKLGRLKCQRCGYPVWRRGRRGPALFQRHAPFPRRTCWRCGAAFAEQFPGDRRVHPHPFPTSPFTPLPAPPGLTLNPALTEAELETVRRCLVAILEGPFLEREEFPGMLGVDLDGLEELVRLWPRSLADPRMPVAVANALGVLWAYPHYYENLVPEMTGATVAGIRDLSDKAVRRFGW